MSSTRSTRSSVLGKRAHQQDASSLSTATKSCDQLQTPDSTPNPKRARTASSVVEGDCNKENVPPFNVEAIEIDSPSSARAVRVLRRNATEFLIATPTRPTLRKTASTSSLVPATPTMEISNLVISTPPPTPPNVLLPIHARARALLRSTCNSPQIQIAGRDAERAIIRDFLVSFINGTATDEEASITSLYISGTPGTGKTALVNSIIRALGSDLKVITINCMALKSVDALWERLIEEFEIAPKRKVAGKAKKVKGREAVEALLASLRTKCIVMLDELDHITPNSQSLSALFSLPDATPSSLRLIGIANTHTLTASSTTAAFSSAANVQTLHFAPYTPAQLLEILQSRLASLYEVGEDTEETVKAAKKLLPTPALTLLTKKIAALTGDVRSLFEVLRGAIDLAVAPALPTPDANPLNTPTPSVTPNYILAALKAYTPSSVKPKVAAASVASASVPTTTSNSEIVTKVRNLGLQHRLVLLAVLLASKRLEAGMPLSASASVTASPKKAPSSPIKRSASVPSALGLLPGVGVDTAQLHNYYTTVLNRTDSGIFEPVSRSEFGDITNMLEGVGLVTLFSTLSSSTAGNKSRRGFGRSASFGAGLNKTGGGTVGEVRLAEGVWGDEILRGLGVSGQPEGTVGDIQDEEIRGIWEREKTRLARDLKISAAATSARKGIHAFSEASED
ncbi:P-loop containing nucleoside triphosphate hydrolase protein [Crucibulum laeve]|uniref:P-loop containing nucleoside triphosphate hydrolase protein n=1 Tax=Crucibulum laeve TaxID=68775 RepID=A0A5C3MHR3_9AGAR|nr:P-loop containing nucleoside triphosphate hydrolase protein [Crucibulum laeve]